MKAAGFPANATSVSHGRRKTSLFSALLDESGLKPSLATTHAEASLRVDATLLGQGESWEHGCWDRVSATFLGRGGRGSTVVAFLVCPGEGRVNTCLAVRSSCQTRALIRMCGRAGRNTDECLGQCDVRRPWMAKCPCSPRKHCFRTDYASCRHCLRTN